MVPGSADGKRHSDPQEGCAESEAEFGDFAASQPGEQHEDAGDAVGSQAERSKGDEAHDPKSPGRAGVRGRFCRFVPAREIGHHRLAHREKRLAAQLLKHVRVLHEIEHPGMRNVGTLDLLDLELFRPGNHRPPHELIEQHDDGDHSDNAPENGARIACAGRSLQVRTETGKTEIALAEFEHLAGHKEEPSAGDRHHRIPHQADGGEGQFDFGEALPPTEAVDLRGFAHLGGNIFERRIKAKGHVPDLSGENQQDRAEFNA